MKNLLIASYTAFFLSLIIYMIDYQELAIIIGSIPGTVAFFIAFYIEVKSAVALAVALGEAQE